MSAQRSMMRLASFGASKRSPAFIDGTIGDADLLVALLVLWPLIAFGGINRRTCGDLQAHKTGTRVKAFFDGNWGKWLNVLEGTNNAGGPRKATSKPAIKRLAALEKISIGALSRANAVINTNEGLRCAQSESSEGREAVKESFGVKHQVAGGSLGEDSRAQLQGFARAMDEAAASEYAGASAGYPR